MLPQTSCRAFFTTKAVGHGSGLGLFITFEIIEEHGGCISAAHRPEGGAEFRIRLPQRSAGVSPASLTPAGETPTLQKTS